MTRRFIKKYTSDSEFVEEKMNQKISDENIDLSDMEELPMT